MDFGIFKDKIDSKSNYFYLNIRNINHYNWLVVQPA